MKHNNGPPLVPVPMRRCKQCNLSFLVNRLGAIYCAMSVGPNDPAAAITDFCSRRCAAAYWEDSLVRDPLEEAHRKHMLSYDVTDIGILLGYVKGEMARLVRLAPDLALQPIYFFLPRKFERLFELLVELCEIDGIREDGGSEADESTEERSDAGS